MNETELLIIAHEYYPINIDCIAEKDSYVKSMQFKILLKKIQEHKKGYPNDIIVLIEEFRALIKTTKFVFNDTTYFEWHDRCYTFEFVHRDLDDTTLILKFYKSIIAPFFFVEYFQTNVINNVNRYFKASKGDFHYPDFINGIYSIAKKIGLKELDPELADKKVPDINFDDIPMGEFTYFNIFFNSQNLK